MSIPLSRRDALKQFGAVAALGLGSARWPASRATPPNIVFIVTDDQRHDAVSVAGNPILRTPNVDRIAQAARVRELRERMSALRRERGDTDPPGPVPVAAPCGDGVNNQYGPP